MMGRVPGSAAPYETLDREAVVAGPSERSFGLVFAAVFGIVALFPLWRGEPVRTWSMVVSAAFLVSAVAWPRMLAPANRVWFRLGLILHRVVNPLVMGVLFYVVLTPFAVVMRRFRPGLTRRLHADPAAASYWIPREESDLRMDQQF